MLHLISLLLFRMAFANGPTQTPGLSITHLTDNFYVYTSYKLLDGKPFPANGIYTVTDSGVVMIDTPWEETDTEPLLDSIARRHNKKVVLCVATHYHADRTAGLDVLKKKGIKTYTTRLTRELAKQHGDKQAEFVFNRDTVFRVGQVKFAAYYPGEGHTKDNIVIWFPEKSILVGGCLVKSTELNDLGNVADANVEQWPQTIRNVISAFPSPKHIIPGHYGWESRKALKHTLKLLEKK